MNENRFNRLSCYIRRDVSTLIVETINKADGCSKILTARLNVVDIDPGIIPRGWPSVVPLHKSLDLSLLTHRDRFAAHCCPQGVLRRPYSRAAQGSYGEGPTSKIIEDMLH